MGWRFRRNIRLGPLRFNLSKSGIGASLGIPGFRVGKDAKGRTYQQTSLPGTGIYRRDYLDPTNPLGQRQRLIRWLVLIGVAIVSVLFWVLFIRRS